MSNTQGFPDNFGLIKINDEVITYESKTDISFVNCTEEDLVVLHHSQIHQIQKILFLLNTAQNHEKIPVDNLSILFLDEFLKKQKTIFIWFSERFNL